VRYRPPRRESIADHLAVARTRVNIPYGEWTDKTATADWALDLHKCEIVNGPVDVDKAEGPGRGKRYLPRDYRELLTVIRLKARGVKRRSAWIAHLWLGGHDYPVERFRKALLAEVRAMRKDVIADFAPRGLWRKMDFRKQYERYIAKRAAQGKEEESAIFSYLAAWQMAPDRIREITPDVAGIATELSEAIGADVPGLESALGEVFAAFASGGEISQASGNVLMEAVRKTPFGGFIEALAADENLRKEVVEDFPKRIRGVIDDGRAGTDTSSLISTVKKASEVDFVRARRWYRGIRTGDLEKILRDAMSEVQTAEAAMLMPLLKITRFQREVMHVNPILALHIYVNILQSDVPIELLEAKDRPTFRQVMDALRNR
jgi:hypothetical protein